MASIKSYPNNSDVYIGAQEVMHWHHGRRSGVFEAGDNCKVTTNNSGMSVAVSDGVGWLSDANGDGIVWWISDAREKGIGLTLPVDTADSSRKRIDRVVVRWATTDYATLPEVIVLTGVASSSPIAPSLTNNDVVREISLARITIPAGTTSITQSMITDEREDDSVCGFVRETYADKNLDVAGRVQELEKFKQTTEKELSKFTVIESGYKEGFNYLKYSDGRLKLYGTLTIESSSQPSSGTVKTVKYALPFAFANTNYVASLTPALNPMLLDWYGATIASGGNGKETEAISISYKYNSSTKYAVKFDIVLEGKYGG